MEKTQKGSEHWFQTPPGSLLLALEQGHLQRMLARQFGDILVQLVGPGETLFSPLSPITHQIAIGPYKSSHQPLPYIAANFEELPLRPDSIDIVICMHVLEFVEDPSEVLDQIYQALVPQGQILIFGFNPVSIWGLNQVFKKSQGFPWDGQFYSMNHMKTLLQKTGFNLTAKKTFAFRPPVKNKKLWQTGLFMEPLGQFLMPDFGGVYCISARKKIFGMNPALARNRNVLASCP